MTDQTPEVTTLDPEQASTNFYWLLGRDEVFNLQTTVRGIVTHAQITAHIESVKDALKSVVALGGHAKQVGRNNDPVSTQPLPPVQGNLPHTLPEPGKLQPKAPAPNGEAGETKTITVEKIKKVVNENGKTLVKVFGAPYMKYGVVAWPEAVGELFDVDQMEIGKEYVYEAKANVLIVDGKPKKVVSFS